MIDAKLNFYGNLKMLTEHRIIEIFQEEYEKKTNLYLEKKLKKAKVFNAKVGGLVIRPPLEVTHIATGLKYTVVASSPTFIELQRNDKIDSSISGTDQNPMSVAKKFRLTLAEFEKDYAI